MPIGLLNLSLISSIVIAVLLLIFLPTGIKALNDNAQATKRVADILERQYYTKKASVVKPVFSDKEFEKFNSKEK